MLRLFNTNDLASLVKIETLTQLAPWSEEVFKRCLEAGSAGWVVELDRQIVGFIMVLFQLDEVHILNLCIHPEYQHQGWGFQLLKHTLDDIKQAGGAFVYLEVRCSNKNAIALYKKLGFKQIGERKGYYTLPQQEDALVFARDLGKE